MTIRFAAAWGGATPAIMRALCPSAPLGAVNDNQRSLSLCRNNRRPVQALTEVDGDGRALTEALRHFARHGFAAAVIARTKAMEADAAGDGASRDRWLAICRQLDRRMAESCAQALFERG